MFKPLCAAGAAGLATFAALVTAATPSQATGSCSIVLPAKTYIASQVTPITARPGPDCAAAHLQSAAWSTTPRGPGYVFFADTRSESYGFLSSGDTVGVLHLQKEGAFSSDFTPVTQNNVTYAVKYATWAYIASSRASTAVYINALVHQWSRSDLASGGGRTIYLQRFVNGAWQSMLSRISTGTGQMAVGFIQRSVYQYRLVVTETGSAWSATSGSAFR